MSHLIRRSSAKFMEAVWGWDVRVCWKTFCRARGFAGGCDLAAGF